MSRTKMIKSKLIFEGEMIESVAEVPAEKIKAWGPDSSLKTVGTPVPRKDGYDKVSGTARYTFDILLPNTCYAKTLRSPLPHAHIKHIDTTQAERLNGVLAVITHMNTPSIPWYGTSFLFDPHVRYIGDEVACIAAETEAIAAEALKVIRVDYEPLPFVLDAGKAMKESAPLLYETGNIMGGKPSLYARGDIEAGLKESDFIVSEEFKTQVVVHNPTEVHCSLVNWEGDYLTVWDSTQGIYAVRDAVANSLKLPASKVRVIKKYMGGGFGSKLACGKYTVMAALLAKKTGRPVKITLDREEMNLAVGNRPDSVQKITVGVKKSGELTALSLKSYGASGAYPSGAGCSWPMRTIYKCSNVSAEEYSVFINAGPGRPFRAPGHVQGVFALDSALDVAAEKIDMDPLEFRLKNYAEMDQVYNIPYTSKRLKECYEQGAKAIGWNQRNKQPGSAAGRFKRGIGMASQIWWGGGGPPAQVVLKLNRDATIELLCGTQDIGTGSYTILAQVVSEVLELPVDDIRVILGDTAVCPFAPSSGGSVTAPSISPAARDAAEQMKAKLFESAAVILETDLSELVYSQGSFKTKDGSDRILNIRGILEKINERVLITKGAREENPDGFMINSFGAQFADVEVDTVTGKICVKRIVAAHDIGRILNPVLLENQFEGGILQGIAYALMENRIIDHNTGAVLTTNLHDYKIPTVADIPEIKVIIVSDGDPLISNTGVKGIGEPPIIPTAGAIANAVYNAIGVRINEIPMSPDVVLNAITT